jgi:hypothetical protein
VESDRRDSDQGIPEQDLGMAYTEDSGYLTGNDDNSPDTPEALEATGAPYIDDSDLPAGEDRDEDEGLPGEGDSRVGLGGVTGTERFAPDVREHGHIEPDEQARIGDADMKTQEAVYHQYMEHRDDSR